MPLYVCTAEGPDHNRHFTVHVELRSGRHGKGAGRTKKEAEMQAAQAAYREISSAEGAADPGDAPSA